MKIARIRYHVPSLEGLESFYCGHLGMQSFQTDGRLVVGYDSQQCLLEFTQGDYQPYEAAPDSFYWKIGITFRDLDKAVAELRRQGLAVPDPRQFLDVGYLCHLRDPNGFSIELLQQGFEGNHTAVETGGEHPIAVQATLAHVTLRVTNLPAIQSLCEQTLDMRLMSVQRISLPGRKFDLHFYAWSNESLPIPDVEAVANREWLYARPYTILEIQHLIVPEAEITKQRAEESGFAALVIEDANGQIHDLSAKDLAVAQ